MIFYRTRQSWLPRKLFSLEPRKLVLCICNDQQLACYLPGAGILHIECILNIECSTFHSIIFQDLE